MELFTKQQRAKLIRNFKQVRDGYDYSECQYPVVKLFNPCGAATWLLSEYDPETDTAFGLCDLGMGSPELGYVYMPDLRNFKGPLDIGIERDLRFIPYAQMQWYSYHARKEGAIVYA
jgi:hypothetical protein